MKLCKLVANLKNDFMKKTLLLLSFASFLSNAQVSSFPWTETFEDASATSSQWVCEYISGTNSSVPSGLFWSIKTTTSVGYYTSTGAYQGSKMAVFDTRSHSRDALARFISPVMNLSGVSNPKLDFYYRNMVWGSDQNELKIYYRTSATGTWTLITTFNTNVATWTNSGEITLPSPSATYQIALEGVAKYGYGLDVDNLKVNSANLSVSDVDAKSSELSVFPNPVSDVLNIKTKLKIAEFTISDVSGKNVKTGLSGSNQVSVRDLKSGMYFLTIKYSDGQVATSKFIKK